jgi:hypothetical protein
MKTIKRTPPHSRGESSVGSLGLILGIIGVMFAMSFCSDNGGGVQVNKSGTPKYIEKIVDKTSRGEDLNWAEKKALNDFAEGK